MTITVLSRRRARPGQGAALIAAAARLIREHDSRNQTRRIRLFQGLDDPDVTLTLSGWESRESARVEEWERTGSRSQEVDALCTGPAEHSFFHWLSSYEDMSRHAAVITCALVRSPREASAAVHALLLRAGRPEAGARQDVVLRHLYQDDDAPERFLVILGWDSPAALERARADTALCPSAQLGHHGATVERFIERTQAEVDRYARPGARHPEACGSSA